MTATAHAPRGTEGAEQVSETKPVIIKLARQRRSRIRQLLKGEGKLVNEVQGAIAELKQKGVISATAQPVIVVVRERSSGLKLFS
jgi:hypothetical protein